MIRIDAANVRINLPAPSFSSRSAHYGNLRELPHVAGK
jgi:hypothetical protein